MNSVIYRELNKKDYETVKELIADAFGFNEFIKNKKLLDAILNAYLKECIVDSSFSKVAEKDNKVIGFILGNAKNDTNMLKEEDDALSNKDESLALVMESEDNKKVVKEFLKITDTYKEIIKGKEDTFQGCIQLFVVSKESRGLGVGKNLIKYLYNYMKSKDVHSIYLYTDTRCNYGFYESQNFKRINEKEIAFDYLKENLNVFLYGYNL